MAKKTLREKNTITLYIREKYKEMWEKFTEEVEKDTNFNNVRYREHSVVSVAIMTLVYQYLLNKGVITQNDISS